MGLPSGPVFVVSMENDDSVVMVSNGVGVGVESSSVAALMASTSPCATSAFKQFLKYPPTLLTSWCDDGNGAYGARKPDVVARKQPHTNST